MKVAILGGGLAGLSAAYQLERHCIFPTVFEQEYKVGARFPNTEALMNVLHHPLGNSFDYLANQHQFYVHPLNPLERLIIHSPSDQVEIRGQLGHITARGNYKESLEIQLRDRIKSEIIYNSYYNLDDLKEQFDRVILATGNPNESKRLGVWTTDVIANLIGVSVSGSFDPKAALIWLDNDFAPGGYCFLLPYDDQTASLTLAVPGIELDLDDLWNKFQKKVVLPYQAKDTLRINHYEIGRTKQRQLDEIYLIGNAGGFNLPFLGFGQLTSMISGIKAADCIFDNLDFNQELKKLEKDYVHSLTMRQALTKLDNNGYDRMIRLLKNPLAQSLFKNRKFSVLRILSTLLGPLI